MMLKYNYLLIGNSRLHWAIKKGEKYKFSHSPINNPIPQKINTNNLIWASVGKYQTNLLKQKNELKIQDIELRDIPKHFGIDRALGCFAALRITDNPNRKDIIIADFGTTLSITKINATGLIIGGQIIPGFLTQLRSMVQSTRDLKMPTTLDIPKANYLIDTQKAMIKGVQNSLIGALNLAFNPGKDILIICGGDTEIIEPNFCKESDVFINPDLVMKGMIMTFPK